MLEETSTRQSLPLTSQDCTTAPLARATEEADAHGRSPNVFPGCGGRLLRPRQGRHVGDGLQSHGGAARRADATEGHRQEYAQDDHGQAVDGSRSFLARAQARRRGSHGRFPSSIVVTVQRATPPDQPNTPR